jgi:UDP-N-acetylglucosamine 2-epimerase (non-hydrolysing)
MTGEHGRERLRKHGLIDIFDDRFTITRKVSYPEFVAMLAEAAFVLTDSGGLQQECAYLGIPCLVHRVRTESSLGLGRNVVLSGLSVEAARRFLEQPERFRSISEVALHHPSDVIVDDLESMGLLQQ